MYLQQGHYIFASAVMLIFLFMTFMEMREKINSTCLWSWTECVTSCFMVKSLKPAACVTLDPFFILLCTALSQEADCWGSCHPGFPAPWLPDGFDQWKAQQASGGHQGKRSRYSFAASSILGGIFLKWLCYYMTA